MISLGVSFAALLLGYLLYGKLAENVFEPDDRPTPAQTNFDGVDYVPMSTPRAFLVHLLNIAGTGPIFGALMGAVYGPGVMLWIVFGSVLIGAVHDYMAGMMSCRYNGQSMAQLAGIYFGKNAKQASSIFIFICLLFTGTVMVISPAMLLGVLFPAVGTKFWMIAIFIYCFAATMFPIDKVIGKIYPFFGALLIFMAIGILYGILTGPHALKEFTLEAPKTIFPIWPYLFVTVACGAVSGFHGTQAPMISRCVQSERNGRLIFYGAMLAEGVIALIWATAGATFYESPGALHKALNTLGQSGVVYEISVELLGPIGSVLALLGTIICPISTADTAFRGTRLLLAEWLNLPQKTIASRLQLTVPLLVVSALLSTMDFNAIWRYFGWSNQTFAMFTLWCATAYLIREKKQKWGSLLTALPAAFMTAVSTTYIMMAKEGFSLSSEIAYPVGCAVAVSLFAVYLFFCQKHNHSQTA